MGMRWEGQATATAPADAEQTRSEQRFVRCTCGNIMGALVAGHLVMSLRVGNAPRHQQKREIICDLRSVVAITCELCNRIWRPDGAASETGEGDARRDV